MPSQWEGYAYVFVNPTVTNIIEPLINNFCQIEPEKLKLSKGLFQGLRKWPIS